jgi:uncharacterized repeat protein (TIGR03806 family)
MTWHAPAWALLCASLCACSIDDANPIPPPGGSSPVDRLSELGIFEGDLATQTPRSDFFGYEVNVPLYSDGASKFRFVYVPPGSALHATDDRWGVPAGSYLVKTFYYPKDARDPSLGRRLLETRFLVKHQSGFAYSIYLWNDDQTDAVATGGNLDIPVSWIDENGIQHDDGYHVPGITLCDSCHRGRALGLRNRQMAGVDGGSSDDQIARLVDAGVLDQPPLEPDPLVAPFGSAPLADRARAYLDANCGHCHAKDGPAAGTKVYWARENTDQAHLPSCKATAGVDGKDRVLVPGRPEASEFLARMRSSDPFVRMPRGPLRVPDGAAIALLSQWVAAMPAGCP